MPPPPPGPRFAFLAYLRGDLVDRAALAAEAARLRREQDLATRLHEAAAIASFFMLVLPTSLAELALAPAGLAALLRAGATRRLWLPLWRQPLPALLLAFLAWQAVALLWSPDPALGVEQAGSLRWTLLILFVQPVLHVRGKLIAALTASFLLGNAVQLANLWSLYAGGPDAFEFGRLPGRASGWWDPAVAGVLLTAALGLALPGLRRVAPRRRAIPALAAAGAVLGVVLSGARAGWIASLILLLAAGLAALRRAASPRAWRWGALAAVAVSAALALTLPLGQVTARVHEGYAEIRRAVVDRDFDSSTGSRLAMKMAAIDAFAARPLTGVGTGGFSAWAREHTQTNAEIHDHAHDVWLHLLASQGIPGAALFALLAAAALTHAARAAATDDDPAAAGPLWALAGLLLVSPFDTLHVSTSSAALLAGLLALCPVWSPADAPPA